MKAAVSSPTPNALRSRRSRRRRKQGLANFEGIVSKRLGSRYRSGRSTDWLKFKNSEAPAVKREGRRIEDMVCVGFRNVLEPPPPEFDTTDGTTSCGAPIDTSPEALLAAHL